MAGSAVKDRVLYPGAGPGPRSGPAPGSCARSPPLAMPPGFRSSPEVRWRRHIWRPAGRPC